MHSSPDDTGLLIAATPFPSPTTIFTCSFCCTHHTGPCAMMRITQFNPPTVHAGHHNVQGSGDDSLLALKMKKKNTDGNNPPLETFSS